MRLRTSEHFSTTCGDSLQRDAIFERQTNETRNLCVRMPCLFLRVGVCVLASTCRVRNPESWLIQTVLTIPIATIFKITSEWILCETCKEAFGKPFVKYPEALACQGCASCLRSHLKRILNLSTAQMVHVRVKPLSSSVVKHAKHSYLNAMREINVPTQRR